MDNAKHTQQSGLRIALALVVAAFVVIASATVYFAGQEIAAIEERHESILLSEVSEAANSVSQFVNYRQQLVETYALEKQSSLQALAANPGDDVLRSDISDSLKRWFPSFFTFTIADRSGNDLIDDLDGFVGQACKANIQDFVHELKTPSRSLATYETVIHPQANHYHFDVMAPWRDGNELGGVFFVSFTPDALVETLASHQSPDHFLVVLNKDRENLIELSAEGSRDRISAFRDIYLSDEEVSEIRATKDIAGSRWQLVGYLKPGLISSIKKDKWTNAIIVLICLLIAGTISCIKMLQLARQQKAAFDDLQVSNRTLQEMASQQAALRESAEAGERTKAQFLASMSHEIRTPLNAVIGLTDLVLKTDLTKHQQRYLSNVALAGRNLLGLINDILDYSKIEAGKLEIDNVEFDISAVLKNVSIVVDTKAADNGNEVIFDVDPDIPAPLIGDPLRIGQILTNLAGNAAKFTTNGEIVIRVWMERTDTQTLLNASVADTGIGMTEEQTARLFQHFVQADQSVTRTHGGTGLGLSISKELTEAMGGSIGVESTPGEGSRFFFTIPVGVPEHAVPHTAVKTIDPGATRILLVDDNEAVRVTLHTALGKLGFDIDVAASGEEAIEAYLAAVDAQPYDAVLLDLLMPGMNGLECIARLRSETDSPLPLILMVSMSDPDSISDDVAKLGIRHILQKPINTSFLIDELMALMHENRDGASTMPDARAKAPAAAASSGHRLLLAEDNELNQMVALGILEDAGYAVDVADNGQAAVDLLKKHGEDYYALVLMDIQMPELDGISASRIIRNDLGFGELPIIPMTAHALDEEKERCRDAGMNDHITKPVDARELLAKIELHTDGRDAAETDGSDDASTPSQTPAFDLDKVVTRLMLPEERVRRLLRKFVDEYSGADEHIGDALRAGDAAQAKLLAHSLKGVAATMGADDLSAKAAALEDTLKTGHTGPAATQQLDELRHVLTGSMQAIESVLEGTPQ